ncbi:MAG: MlaE family lipid ABC transporter permease subunit [Planctomycetes bacterium]|nr:MlaE family lipid ABC transporter permease subunit [Planctomycetota bacterium]
MLRLRGSLRFADAHRVWSEFRAAALPPPSGGVVFDLSEVERLDGGVAALIVELQSAISCGDGTPVDLRGASADVAEILTLYGCQLGCERTPPAPVPLLTQIGAAAAEVLDEARGGLEFLGAVIVAWFSGLRRPATLSWSQIWPVLERAGADGLPIVMMFGFLVGFIMAFQGAVQLEQFGASIFVADLVGLTITRELGPLMTAIVVCGRSGAAFAAELGTMKVSEEIDALKTLGFDPLRHLVIPRILALVIALPVLTLVADVMGLVGGLLVGLFSLDLTPMAYIHETQGALELWDVTSGLLKSLAFALAIGGISCQQGLATTGGAAGVGRRTTTAVVSILFSLILIDAGFAVAFNALGV